MHLANPRAATPLLTLFVDNAAATWRLRGRMSLEPWLLDEFAHADRAMLWKRTRTNPARLAKLEAFCKQNGLSL